MGNKKAIGIVETKGLISGIEALDAMLKAANVTLLKHEYVGSGLVTIVVQGDVSAVTTAVDSGVAAVLAIDENGLQAQNVIPRPDLQLYETLLKKEKPKALVWDTSPKESESKQEKSVDSTEQEKTIQEAPKEVLVQDEEREKIQEIEVSVVPEQTEDKKEDKKEDPEKYDKVWADDFYKQMGIEETMKKINQLTVVELKELAGMYEQGSIAPNISKARKQEILDGFKKYYKNEQESSDD